MSNLNHGRTGNITISTFGLQAKEDDIVHNIIADFTTHILQAIFWCRKCKGIVERRRQIVCPSSYQKTMICSIVLFLYTPCCFHTFHPTGRILYHFCTLSPLKLFSSLNPNNFSVVPQDTRCFKERFWGFRGRHNWQHFDFPKKPGSVSIDVHDGSSVTYYTTQNCACWFLHCTALVNAAEIVHSFNVNALTVRPSSCQSNLSFDNFFQSLSNLDKLILIQFNSSFWPKKIRNKICTESSSCRCISGSCCLPKRLWKPDFDKSFNSKIEHAPKVLETCPQLWVRTGLAIYWSNSMVSFFHQIRHKNLSSTYWPTS